MKVTAQAKKKQAASPNEFPCIMQGIKSKEYYYIWGVMRTNSSTNDGSILVGVTLRDGVRQEIPCRLLSLATTAITLENDQ